MLILNVRCLGLHSSKCRYMRYDAENRPIYTRDRIDVVQETCLCSTRNIYNPI